MKPGRCVRCRDREHGVRRNRPARPPLHTPGVALSGGSARSTDSHPLDSIKQSCDEKHAVDTHIGDHHGAVILYAGALDESPRAIPSYGCTSAERHAEPGDLIVAAPLHSRTLAEGLAQQLNSRLNPSVASDGFHLSQSSHDVATARLFLSRRSDRWNRGQVASRSSPRRRLIRARNATARFTRLRFVNRTAIDRDALPVQNERARSEHPRPRKGLRPRPRSIRTSRSIVLFQPGADAGTRKGIRMPGTSDP